MSFFEKFEAAMGNKDFRCHDGTYAPGLDNGDALNWESARPE